MPPGTPASPGPNRSFGSTLSLGPFDIDAAGRLHPRAADPGPGFSVRWRGRTLRARLREGTLALEATLGRVPSSAGAGVGPGQRERAFAALRALPTDLPGSFRLSLAADHRVRIETEQRLETPPTAVRLVTEVACFLLQLDPILSRLDAAGLTGATTPTSGSAVAGTA